MNIKKALILVCMVATFTAASAQSQWRGPNRDGIYSETGLLKSWPAEGPKMLWSYEGIGTGMGSVAVSKDKVFVTGIPDTLSAEGFLFSFDLKGKLLWKKSYGKDWVGIFPGARSTPTVVDNLLYLENGNGSVLCLKTENGEKVWSVDFFSDLQCDSVQFGFSESVLIDGDKLYCTPGGKTNNVGSAKPVHRKENLGISRIWRTGDLYLPHLNQPQRPPFTGQSHCFIHHWPGCRNR